ncbi:MAG: C39 family peptidase [Parcubacteria group bacterium]|jgi:hypothetical protein
MAKFSKYLYIISALAIIIGGFFVLSKKSAEAPVGEKTQILQDLPVGNNAKEETNAPAPASTSRDATPLRGGENILPEKNKDGEKNIPDKILIKVPFTTQAPFANWDMLHEESCEEASLIMLKYYLDKKPLTPDIAEKEIQKMVKFEIKNYGDYKDTTASETVKLAEDFYKIGNLKVVYDFQKEDLKKHLAKGNPVIVPAAGRLLGNPNFTAPGPLYHNLVLVGYDGNTVITNDPGTRKGQGYIYNIDVLYNAIHDFPGRPENINQGRKAMIVLE